MSESQSPASWGFPKDVVEKLQETALRVTQGVPAFRALKAILTEEEWRQVKGELASFFPDVFGEPSKEPAKRPPSYAIRKLMELRKISEPRDSRTRAGIEFLMPAAYERLLRAIGEGEGDRKPRKSKLPVWDREECTLRLEGSVIRKVRGPNVAKHVVAILDAFEQQGWRSRVRKPLGEAGQVLHDAVKSLNKGTKRMSFHVGGDGEFVTWRWRRAR